MANQEESDVYSRFFGDVEPSTIPETTQWYKKQQRDLFAVVDDAEKGPPSTMTTVTQNDSSSEMLAAIRRGPLAPPTEDEQLEYLVGIHDMDSSRPEFERYAYEHVLSYQRRVQALKKEFMQRYRTTPRGVYTDLWDTTEAQQRAALHGHILDWHKRRQLAANYTMLPALPRAVTGNDDKQRPAHTLTVFTLAH